MPSILAVITASLSVLPTSPAEELRVRAWVGAGVVHLGQRCARRQAGDALAVELTLSETSTHPGLCSVCDLSQVLADEVEVVWKGTGTSASGEIWKLARAVDQIRGLVEWLLDPQRLPSEWRRRGQRLSELEKIAPRVGALQVLPGAHGEALRAWCGAQVQRAQEACRRSTGLDQEMLRRACELQHLEVHPDAVEDDEVLIAPGEVILTPGALLLVRAYELSRREGTVLRGPRYLSAVLSDELGVTVQTTPAPRASVAEAACALYDPQHPETASLRRAVLLAEAALAEVGELAGV